MDLFSETMYWVLVLTIGAALLAFPFAPLLAAAVLALTLPPGVALDKKRVKEQSTANDCPLPTLVEKQETIGNPEAGFKPNFLKFVVVTDKSKPFHHFLPGCDAKPPLKQQEDAVRLYSGNSVYQQMNQALRNDDVNGLQNYGSLINLTMQPFSFDAMQKAGALLTPFVGTVWRGCTLSQADQSKYYVGNVILWEGFSSTSKSSETAFGGNCI